MKGGPARSPDQTSAPEVLFQQKGPPSISKKGHACKHLAGLEGTDCPFGIYFLCYTLG